ncbi:hypothetical protein HDU76_008870 [Blyttiomyces sp. JEL0837]|nr:hypothetical protein HDU76_008870 [Blyttiomyces sp. JEL0837]
MIDWKGLTDSTQKEPVKVGWRKYGLVVVIVVSGFVVLVMYPFFLPAKLLVEGAIAVYEKSKKGLVEAIVESRDPTDGARREQLWNGIWGSGNESSSANESSSLLNSENSGSGSNA